jgi:hypothetical protein
MKKLYQKIKIDNFEKVQEELLNLMPEDKKEIVGHFASWIVDINSLLDQCPTLNKFIKERSLKPLDQIKFYVSAPGHGTYYHTDGSIIRQPFGLTLPLKNTKDSYLSWYEEDYENFMLKNLIADPVTEFECVVPQVWIPRDVDKLRLLDSIEIDEPTFTRSDFMHNVTNNTGLTRSVCVVRWDGRFKNFSDVIDLTDITID